MIFLQTGLFAPDETADMDPAPAPNPTFAVSQIEDVIARIPTDVMTPSNTEVPPSQAPVLMSTPASVQIENPELKALTTEILAGLGVVMPATQGIDEPVDELRSLTSIILAGLPSAIPVGTQGQSGSETNALSIAIASAVRAGQSEVEIDALIATYVDARINQAAVTGAIQVPEAFFTADGRVDSATLLTTLTNAPSLAVPGQTITLTPLALAKTTIGTDGQRYYAVTAGDSLASLAHKFYGDAILYKNLYDANRDKLSSPNMIKIGQRLRIPG